MTMLDGSLSYFKRQKDQKERINGQNFIVFYYYYYFTFFLILLLSFSTKHELLAVAS